jgi:UDP-N-acetylglucosamine acyltransferase
MVGAHLGHNVRLGSNTILANNVLLGGYAEVNNYVFIGGGSVVHQFTRLGAVSLLQGLTAVGKDVPPFAIAVGKDSVAAINVVGLRRRNYNPTLRKEVKQAFKIFYGSGLNTSQALEESERHLWSEEVALFWHFVSSSKRGICPMARWTDVKWEAANGDHRQETDHRGAAVYTQDPDGTTIVHSTANNLER